MSRDPFEIQFRLPGVLLCGRPACAGETAARRAGPRTRPACEGCHFGDHRRGGPDSTRRKPVSTAATGSSSRPCCRWPSICGRPNPNGRISWSARSAKARRTASVCRWSRSWTCSKNEQLGDAIGREEHLVTNLKGLLELLQSEDRRHQLEEEKKWLESVHEEIGKLSVREKELRRATEGQKKPDSLAERQAKIGRRRPSRSNRRSTSRTRLETRQTGPTRRGSNRPNRARARTQKIKTRKTKRTRRTKPASRNLIVPSKPNEDGKDPQGEKQPQDKSGEKSQKGNQCKKATSNRSHRQRGRILPSRLPLRSKSDGSPEDLPFGAIRKRFVAATNEEDARPERNRRGPAGDAKSGRGTQTASARQSARAPG